MSCRTSMSGSIQIGLSASLEKGLHTIGSGPEHPSSGHRHQAFSWDRLHATMAGIRDLQADRNRTMMEMSSIGEVEYDEALSGPNFPKTLPINPNIAIGSGLFMTRRPPSAYFVPGSDGRLKSRVPTSIPSGRSSSEAEKRFSTASAIPAGLTIRPYTLPATVYDRRTYQGPTQSTLRGTPQSPQHIVFSRTLRGSQDLSGRDAKRASFTLADCTYPPETFLGGEEPGQYSISPSKFGASGRAFEHGSLAEQADFHNPAQSMASRSPPLDKGSLACLHALASFFIAFNIWGLKMAFGVFQAYYTFYMFPGIAANRLLGLAPSSFSCP